MSSRGKPAGAKSVSHVLVMLSVASFVLLLIVWGSVSGRLARISSSEELLSRRLEQLETHVRLLREFVGDKAAQQHRAALQSSALASRSPSIAAGQTAVRLAFSTMRRGVADEHVFETIDSLVPFLGGAGNLHFSLAVVVVERRSAAAASSAGEGSASQADYASEIELKYRALIQSGLIRVTTMEEEARASLYEGLVKVKEGGEKTIFFLFLFV